MCIHRIKASVSLLCLLLILPVMGVSHGAIAQGARTIVTTDPELDDNNSLIRFLLYSNEVQLEGLITASSGPHWKGDGRGTVYKGETEADRFGLDICPCTEWRWYDHHIQDVVQAYAEVEDNLRVHDPRYPTAAELKSLIRVGNVAFPGDISQPSPGSDLIKEALLDDEPGPLFLQVWGGPSTVARALLSIEEHFAGTDQWPAIHDKVSRKAIIVAFGEQDDSYRDYIAVKWPDVQFWQLASHVWGYGSRNVVLAGDEKYLGADWLRENVTAKGPLGALYRVWGDGRQMVEGDVFDHFEYRGLTAAELAKRGHVVWTPVQPPGTWISEGDTTAFLNLLDNGLRSYENPAWGGWGGRAVQDQADSSLWVGKNAVDYNDFNGARADYAVARWFGAAQQDFAARLHWSVTDDYRDANHHPVATVERLAIEAAPGESVALNASATDPDGDSVDFRWWHYREAGSYPESVALEQAGTDEAALTIPNDVKPGQTIHVILEATDSGSPALKHYQRVVITIRD